MTHIEFSTRAYERTHGKMPKGTGYWGFSEDLNDTEKFQFFYGTLTQAKAQAKYYYDVVGKQDGKEWMTIHILP